MHMNDRVLILYSWNDDISARRFQAMQQSPLLEDAAFDHCFALEHEEEIINSDELVERVSKCINIFKPSVFLLHTGAAFHRYRDVFLAALPLLKDLHKDLRFGFERRYCEVDEDLVSTGVFDDSSGTREIEDLFFTRIFSRQEGE